MAIWKLQRQIRSLKDSADYQRTSSPPSASRWLGWLGFRLGWVVVALGPGTEGRQKHAQPRQLNCLPFTSALYWVQPPLPCRTRRWMEIRHTASSPWQALGQERRGYQTTDDGLFCTSPVCCINSLPVVVSEWPTMLQETEQGPVVSPAVAVPELEVDGNLRLQGEGKAFLHPLRLEARLVRSIGKMLVALKRGSTACFGLLSTLPRCEVKPGRFSPPGDMAPIPMMTYGGDPTW